MTDYKPVACGFHSELELAIMHGQPLQIRWQETGQSQPQNITRNIAHTKTKTIKPIDLIVRDHKEYLVIEDQSGESRNLRLDYILDVLVDESYETK